MQARFPKVSIIGAGTVGSTLALALAEKGFPIISVISRTGRDAISLAKVVKCRKASTQIADIHPSTDLVLLTVNDGAISDAAEELSKTKKLKFTQVFAVHCSGVHTAEILKPLKSKGATVASVHPIQTFPAGQRIEKLKSKLRGIYYGIDGEPDALRKAEQLIEDLEGKSVLVPREMKALYHVACVFASNYMTVFLNALSDITKTLELKASWTEVFGPLMTTTMENVVKHSPADALTGPIVRGDLATVHLHLATLSKHAPHLLPLYTVNGIELARLAKQHGRISPEEFDKIVATFKTVIQSPPKQIKEKR